MHIIAIGDVHGRNAWKQVKDRTADHIIFIGDYVDPHTFIPDEEVIRNFEDIIDFKKSDPERIVLLLGNHDIHYLHHPYYRCSGYRADLQDILGGLFRQNASLFQIAWQYRQLLFTHAGVSKRWYQKHRPILQRYQQENMASTLNAVYGTKHREILFEAGYSRGGNIPYGGPVWADKSETEHDFVEDYHQVVGHSRVPDIIHTGNEKSSITYIDVQDTQVKFYEITI
jgi:predicted phosphodiesterase